MTIPRLKVHKPTDSTLLPVSYREHSCLFGLLAVSCSIDHHIVQNLLVSVTVDKDSANYMTIEANTLRERYENFVGVAS